MIESGYMSKVWIEDYCATRDELEKSQQQHPDKDAKWHVIQLLDRRGMIEDSLDFQHRGRPGRGHRSQAEVIEGWRRSDSGFLNCLANFVSPDESRGKDTEWQARLMQKLIERHWDVDGAAKVLAIQSGSINGDGKREGRVSPSHFIQSLRRWRKTLRKRMQALMNQADGLSAVDAAEILSGEEKGRISKDAFLQAWEDSNPG